MNLGSSPQPIQQPIAQTQSTTNLDPQKAGFSLQTEQGNWQVYAFIGLIGFALIMYGVNAKKGKDMDAGVSATPEIQPTTKMNRGQIISLVAVVGLTIGLVMYIQKQSQRLYMMDYEFKNVKKSQESVRKP